MALSGRIGFGHVRVVGVVDVAVVAFVDDGIDLPPTVVDLPPTNADLPPKGADTVDLGGIGAVAFMVVEDATVPDDTVTDQVLVVAVDDVGGAAAVAGIVVDLESAIVVSELSGFHSCNPGDVPHPGTRIMTGTHPSGAAPSANTWSRLSDDTGGRDECLWSALDADVELVLDGAVALSNAGDCEVNGIVVDDAEPTSRADRSLAV